MKITDIRFNGIRNPIGYDFNPFTVTFTVSDFSNEEAKLQNAEIELQISKKEDFNEILFSKIIKGSELGETVLSFSKELRTRYFVRILVDGVLTHEPAYFETGKMNEKWEAKWITTNEKDTYHPIFRKAFFTTKKIVKARLYILGLGLYEAYLNGHRIGEEYLSPGIFDYQTELQYQTYDITKYLLSTNDFQVILGNGWYKGRFGLEGKDKLYGERFQLISEIHLTDENGEETVIGSDENFTYYASDVRESSIYDGEIYDHFNKMEEAFSEKKAVLLHESRPLVSRKNVPIVDHKKIPVKELIVTPKNEYVLDFGQNMAGFVSFNANIPASKEIILDYGEILQDGCFYNDNYRSAKSRFVYISGGTEENVWPHFTFFGFRYVRVSGSGVSEKINPENFTAHMLYSNLERTGFFSCSNEKINRLYENAFYGQCSNFLDIPTDCPQRDERMGWTGDAAVFAPAASYNMDTRAFYRKYLHDLRNEQMKSSGGIPNYFPNLGVQSGSCPVWGDAGTFIPDTLFEMYGNASEYENEYEMMKDWTDYEIHHFMKEDHLIHEVFGYGDWLALDGVTESSMRGGTDDDYVHSMFFSESVKKTMKMAKRLKKTSDEEYYKALYEKIRESILDTYFTKAGHLSVDTQTGYILSLRFGIYRDYEVLKKDFLRRLKRDGYQIRAGFAGAPVLCQTLADAGLIREAYHFLLNEEFPGWLYEVNLGATTIWERWNSVNSDGTISGTGMNSLNHYAYGTVVQFLYAHLGGIKPSENGFKEAIIRPLFTGKIPSVQCSYKSVYGQYVCDYEISKNGEIHVHIEIPYGCRASVILYGYQEGNVTLPGGSYDFNYCPEKNLRCVFSEESFLGDVVKNEEARTILQAYVPQGLMFGYGDIEGKTIKLKELANMFYMGADPQKCNEAIQKIKTITV